MCVFARSGFQAHHLNLRTVSLKHNNSLNYFGVTGTLALEVLLVSGKKPFNRTLVYSRSHARHQFMHSLVCSWLSLSYLTKGGITPIHNLPYKFKFESFLHIFNYAASSNTIEYQIPINIASQGPKNWQLILIWNSNLADEDLNLITLYSGKIYFLWGQP